VCHSFEVLLLLGIEVVSASWSFTSKMLSNSSTILPAYEKRIAQCTLSTIVELDATNLDGTPENLENVTNLIPEVTSTIDSTSVPYVSAFALYDSANFTFQSAVLQYRRNFLQRGTR
jgi:hypothetical protein